MMGLSLQDSSTAGHAPQHACAAGAKCMLLLLLQAYAGTQLLLLDQAICSRP
jgi:hypothetical protein